MYIFTSNRIDNNVKALGRHVAVRQAFTPLPHSGTDKMKPE
jgi:hypothetical protein